MSQYLSEAFKKLDTLNEETFSVTDSGLQDFVKFTEDDEDENIIDIIDVDAETVEDLEDSYIGKVILDCCVCHSKLYKDTEDVVIEDDLANVGEECPFCYANDGYKVVGQVAAFDEDDEEEDTEEESEETKEDEEDDEDDDIDESLNESKPINEATKKPSKKEILHILDSAKDDAEVEVGFETLTGYESMSFEKKDGEWWRGDSPISNDMLYDIIKTSKEVYLPIVESINEDINNLSLDTDDTHMEMTSDENGKVTITTEPVSNEKIDENETIAPVEPEVQNEIESNVADGEEIEIDVDEFDEKSFDELSEGYLKKVYENVDSFKTSKVSYNDNELILEGVIKFNSGKAKKTTFLFENKLITKKGKVRFIGENKEIARGKKSFTITGRIDNKKFLSESFNYNYGVKTPLGKVKRLYGTINK